MKGGYAAILLPARNEVGTEIAALTIVQVDRAWWTWATIAVPTRFHQPARMLTAKLYRGSFDARNEVVLELLTVRDSWKGRRIRFM